MPESKQVTMKEIWETLSAIDVSQHVEKINDLDYLPWNIAWEMVMKHYPNSTYDITKYGEARLPFTYNDFGAFVNVSVTIEGHTRYMDLPVMNHAYKAMKPEAYTYKTQSGEKYVAPLDSFAINKNWQRCFVKCLAINFGLGIELYKRDKEDLPRKEDTPDLNWEQVRINKIGGNGKHKDTTWTDIDEGYLHWASGDGNKYQALKNKAINELKYRVENGLIKDFANTTAIKAFVDKFLDGIKSPEATIDKPEVETTDAKIKSDEVPEEILDMRKEVMEQDVYKFVTEKIPNRKEYFDKLINESTEVKQLTLITAKLAGIKAIIHGYKEKEIDKFRFKELLGKITLAPDPKTVSTLTYGFVGESNGKKTTNGKMNDELIEHFRTEIERLHTELGYHEKQSLNSYMKHLKVDDLFACTDVKKLQEYTEYLVNKKHDIDEGADEEPSSVDVDPDDGVIFKDKESDKPLSNPNYTQKEGFNL